MGIRIHFCNHSIDNNRLSVIHKIDEFQINMSKTLHKKGLIYSSGSGMIRIITGDSGTLRNKSILNAQSKCKIHKPIRAVEYGLSGLYLNLFTSFIEIKLWKQPLTRLLNAPTEP